jgi:hypothetical protein
VSATDRDSSDDDGFMDTAASSVLLLYARTPVEDRLLGDWAAEGARGRAVPVRAGRGSLADLITAGGEDRQIVRCGWRGCRARATALAARACGTCSR